MMAMILAAGLGTRLRPYTRLRPKPLFPVLGQPLLFRIIDQLRSAGFGPIVVNAHHLAEQIAAALDRQPDIILQREPLELGTGGGLRLAVSHFGAGPVLITNGDIFHDIDYRLVGQRHQASGGPLTMVMHDYPRFNKVLVSGDRVLGFAPPGGSLLPEARLLAFTGIHVLDPRLLDDIPAGRFSSIIDRYQAHLAAGGPIQALTVSGHRWRDIGTSDDYLDLHRELLSLGPGPAFRLGAGVELGQGVDLRDWGYVGAGASLGQGATLRRVVVWDGVRIPAGAVLSDCLVAS